MQAVIMDQLLVSSVISPDRANDARAAAAPTTTRPRHGVMTTGRPAAAASTALTWAGGEQPERRP